MLKSVILTHKVQTNAHSVLSLYALVELNVSKKVISSPWGNSTSTASKM